MGIKRLIFLLPRSSKLYQLAKDSRINELQNSEKGFLNVFKKKLKFN